MKSKEKKLKTKMEGHRSIIHQIAGCYDCSFSEEYFLNARKKAYSHAKKTGHHVWVETGILIQYNSK